MPLLHDASEESFHQNVEEMIRAGHKRDVALAASYRIRRAAGWDGDEGEHREIMKGGSNIHVKSHYRIHNGKLVYIAEHDRAGQIGHEAQLHERIQQGQRANTHSLMAIDPEDRDAIVKHAAQLGLKPEIRYQGGKIRDHEGNIKSHGFHYVKFGSEEDAKKVHAAIAASGSAYVEGDVVPFEGLKPGMKLKTNVPGYTVVDAVGGNEVTVTAYNTKYGDKKTTTVDKMHWNQIKSMATFMGMDKQDAPAKEPKAEEQPEPPVDTEAIHESDGGGDFILQDGKWHSRNADGELEPYSPFHHEPVSLGSLKVGDAVLLSSQYSSFGVPWRVKKVNEKSVTFESPVTGKKQTVPKEQWESGGMKANEAHILPDPIVDHIVKTHEEAKSKNQAEAPKAEEKPAEEPKADTTGPVMGLTAQHSVTDPTGKKWDVIKASKNHGDVVLEDSDGKKKRISQNEMKEKGWEKVDGEAVDKTTKAHGHGESADEYDESLKTETDPKERDYLHKKAMSYHGTAKDMHERAAAELEDEGEAGTPQHAEHLSEAKRHHDLYQHHHEKVFGEKDAATAAKHEAKPQKEAAKPVGEASLGLDTNSTEAEKPVSHEAKKIASKFVSILNDIGSSAPSMSTNGFIASHRKYFPSTTSGHELAKEVLSSLEKKGYAKRESKTVGDAISGDDVWKFVGKNHKPDELDAASSEPTKAADAKPTVTGAMAEAVNQSVDSLKKRISNVKWAKGDENAITFDLDGVPHHAELKGRNADIMIGHGDEQDAAIAARMLLDKHAKPQSKPANEPVTVRPAGEEKGHAIPAKPVYDPSVSESASKAAQEAGNHADEGGGKGTWDSRAKRHTSAHEAAKKASEAHADAEKAARANGLGSQADKHQQSAKYYGDLASHHGERADMARSEGVKAVGNKASSEKPKSASELASDLTNLRAAKPRPLDKLYGSNGPTPEQKADWEQKMKDWNRLYRHTQKEHAAALERDNKAFHEEQYGKAKAGAEKASSTAKDHSRNLKEEMKTNGDTGMHKTGHAKGIELHAAAKAAHKDAAAHAPTAEIQKFHHDQAKEHEDWMQAHSDSKAKIEQKEAEDKAKDKPSIDDLVRSNPIGYVSDEKGREWAEKHADTISSAAEEASSRAVATGDIKDHEYARMLHNSASKTHSAKGAHNEHRYHYEKSLAHDDYVFAKNRGLEVDPRLQHHLKSGQSINDTAMRDKEYTAAKTNPYIGMDHEALSKDAHEKSKTASTPDEHAKAAHAHKLAALVHHHKGILHGDEGFAAKSKEHATKAREHEAKARG